MIRIAAIGLGNRACKYLEYVKTVPEKVRLAAVVEPHPLKRARIASAFGLNDGQVFRDADELFASGIGLDAVIIASPDNTHYPFTMKALEKGWHVLLEKPAASSLDECLKIRDLSSQTGLIVHVCYVLRFHPLYMKMKELLNSGKFGEVTSIDHVINVGLDRMTHTFVRGLWSKEDESSPIVLSKISHDIDILYWMTGEKAVEVRSEGSLEVYTSANAPSGSAARCVGCSFENECRFSAVDLYLRRDEWNKGFNVYPGETKEEAIQRKLQTGRYGRCVYHCDNDVFDYQTVEIITESGAKINVIMDGRSDKESRETVITCTGGVIRTDGKSITAVSSATGISDVYDMSEYMDMPLHGGADITIIKEFIDIVTGNGNNNEADISSSIHSHEICFMADESCKKGAAIKR